MQLLQTAFQDLRSNPQIVALLPRFVNFVNNGVSTFLIELGNDMCVLPKGTSI